jgi:secreted trypsin-like serine protease
MTIDPATCESKLEAGTKVTDTMMCAGARERDSCKGDSGGPLVYYDGNTRVRYLYGLVSFGDGCGRPDVPGVCIYLGR